MPKRPSIIEKAMAATGGNPPPKRKPREDLQHTSVYIPRTAHDRLREIAFTERCKVHDLIMQGLDLVLEKHGHPEKATRSTTARKHDDATVLQHD